MIFYTLSKIVQHKLTALIVSKFKSGKEPMSCRGIWLWWYRIVRFYVDSAGLPWEGRSTQLWEITVKIPQIGVLLRMCQYFNHNFGDKYQNHVFDPISENSFQHAHHGHMLHLVFHISTSKSTNSPSNHQFTFFPFKETFHLTFRGDFDSDFSQFLAEYSLEMNSKRAYGQFEKNLWPIWKELPNWGLVR